MSDEDKEGIQQNPLWVREIGLAEQQVEKHWPPAEDEYGTADYNRMLCDLEIDPRCVQWLPKGIREESAFNCFVAKETDRPEKHTNALLILRKGNTLDRLLTHISAGKKTVKAAMPKAQE